MHIGLTGGIGCGKTSVLKFFEREAWPIFDSDALCQSLHDDAKGSFALKIEARWGKKFLDKRGCPDKAKIAELVFSDEAERQWLNSIAHPLVREAMIKKASICKNIISDIPLLFEAGWERDFDIIITVWAPEKIRIKRLVTRGMTEVEANRRIKTQMTTDKKLEMADIGLVNSGSWNYLYEQCSNTINALKTKIIQAHTTQRRY
jgi:dephospho-CoA kinase